MDGLLSSMAPSTAAQILYAACFLLLSRPARASGEPQSFWKVQPSAAGPLGLEARHRGDGASPALPPDVSVGAVDVRSRAALRELSRFLGEHYQGEESFCVRQPAARLRWLLSAPGMRYGWAVSLRLDGRLVGFAAALPMSLRIDGERVDAVEVTYLCVHREQRGRKLTGLLLRELARRVAAAGVQHAVYTTANAALPRAVGRARFHHWPLRPRRLIASGFVELEPLFEGLYAARFALPRRTRTVGLRPLRARDLPEAAALVNRLHSAARLGRQFGSAAELGHCALPRRGLVAAYVVECPQSGRVLALLSFALSEARPRAAGARSAWRRALAARGVAPRPIRAATLQLLAADEGVDAAQLLADALVLACRCGCDVLTALDTFQAARLLRPLRFEEGDGRLHFHLYNYGVVPKAGRAPSPAAKATSLSGAGPRRAGAAAQPSGRARLAAPLLSLEPSDIALPMSSL